MVPTTGRWRALGLSGFLKAVDPLPEPVLCFRLPALRGLNADLQIWVMLLVCTGFPWHMHELGLCLSYRAGINMYDVSSCYSPYDTQSCLGGALPS